MRTEEQFDSFYLKSRRALVHQTFALTGDLAAAQRAVHDAYVGAWHHWRKVSAHDDPREWVRPRAWMLAQRRHTARLWHRTKDLRAGDREVLDALHKLPVAERRTLLLVELGGVPHEVAARELSLTRTSLEQLLESARARFAAALDIDPGATREPVAALGDAASAAVLPRPGTVRREGRRRRRTHAAAAAVAVTLLAVGSGAVAHEAERPAAADPGDLVERVPTAPTLAEEESTLPSADDLLDTKAVSSRVPGRWREVDTHDNTVGDGINTVCQRERFADPDGLAALVREFAADGAPSRTLVQTVEISKSGEDAAAAYDRAVSWFAGCSVGQLHLRESFDVRGVGDRATMFVLDSWGSPRTTHSVAVAEVGQVLTSTVLRTIKGDPPATRSVLGTLTEATRRICARTGTLRCRERPRLDPSAPPPAGEETGLLATVDLPRLPGVDHPWVGTSPTPARRNPAATTCDRAEFARQGATRTRTRTFLVPQAELPDRFGLTEVYGTFRSPKAASNFLRTVRQRFAGCEDRDLATDVLSPRSLRVGPVVGSTWRLQTELSENSEVVFDVGFVRRGASVAQLTFVPAARAELASGDFRALVVRSGQRLGELD